MPGPLIPLKAFSVAAWFRLMEERWKNIGQHDKVYHSTSSAASSQSPILNRCHFKSRHKPRLPGTVLFHRGMTRATLSYFRERRSTHFKGRKQLKTAGRITESLKGDEGTSAGAKAPRVSTLCPRATPEGVGRAPLRRRPAGRPAGQPAPRDIGR